ncbi:MAG: dihydroorotase [Rhizobiaceae bacterium]|jgi:dihydroorotase|nr:dihydroorotase [Rhizobiaceae bacterium]
MNVQSRPIVIEQVRIVDPARGLDETGTIIIEKGRIAAAGRDALNQGGPAGAARIDGRGLTALPGLVDTRVFVGEPGSEHRETIKSASRAAAAGGVTTFFMMPDTDPAIDEVATVEFVRRTADAKALVNVRPVAALTKALKGEEIAEFGLMRRAGAVAFSNGHHCIASSQVMRRAMVYARDFGAVVMQSARDSHLSGGVMNEGLFASWLGLPGVPREAELIPLQRDLTLARLTRAAYHAETISCAMSLEALRRAKADGADVTAAACINHLCLNENDVGDYRTFFRLEPPLRAEEDRQALIEALADGTLDMVNSSHDPQDVETKRVPFADAAPGAIGLETLLAAMLRLHHDGRLSLLRIAELLALAPARRFGLEAGSLAPGAPADIALVDLDEPWVFSEDQIVSRCRNSCFEGARFSGRVLKTIRSGVIVQDRDKG